MRTRTPLLGLALLAVTSCAETQTPRAKAPPSDKARAQASESVAFDAERRINAAENALNALQPDEAEAQLKEAKAIVFDKRIETYPDAQVREEVRKKELAAQVEAVRQKLDTARQELKESVAALKKKHPEESDIKRAVEAVQHVKGALEEGQKLEDKDLEYAKYALSVQKELSNEKKTIEQRGLEVAIANQRTEMEANRASLQNASKRLQMPDPSGADFDEARNALSLVDKSMRRRRWPTPSAR